MSALPPKADMCSALADVCFGPIADIITNLDRQLLDQLVCAFKHWPRHSEAKRLGGLEVNDKLEFHRLLGRQVDRLSTFENSPRVEACPSIFISKIGSIAHQSACDGELTIRITCGDDMPRRQHNELNALVREQCFRTYQKGYGVIFCQSCESSIDLAAVTGIQDTQLHT